MIQFILNNTTIRTDLSPGITLLDFIRYHKHLMGTKIGCREGDCGACTVLVGQLEGKKVEYKSVTSCLMPLANAHGKHIVTVEGINNQDLNPVQQYMSDEGATQCGFCTPGFVVSLTGFCIQTKYDKAVAAIDGNICRCTGYKSIERAARNVEVLLKNRKQNDPVRFAIENKIIPEYFSSIPKRLLELSTETNGYSKHELKISPVFVGGGTDLYVQKHEEMTHSAAMFLSDVSSLEGIKEVRSRIVLGGSTTVTDLLESPLIREIFPEFLKYSKLVSSTQIRNMATLGGNFVNASPIGDFTVFFLALNAGLKLSDGKKSRNILLRDFYKGYKSLDKRPNEYIEEISFAVPSKNTLFNFEKVSKRTNLDIASVNSAISIAIVKNKIIDAGISAGGVGPIPMYLKKTSEYLIRKDVSESTIESAAQIAGGEIKPISDARGSATYKRFLLQQLIKAHFITLFPFIKTEKLQSTYEEY